MASMGLKADIAGNVIPVIGGGTWVPASRYQKKILGAAKNKLHRVGDQIYLSKQKSKKTAIPLFGGFNEYVTNINPEKNFIVTIPLENSYVSCRFFNDVPIGEEVIHTSLSTYQTWLSNQAEDVLYCCGGLVEILKKFKSKTIHEFELSQLVSSNKQFPIEAAQYINFRQFFTIVSIVLLVMAAVYLLDAHKKAAAARLKDAENNVETGVMDTDHFMLECLKNLDFTGPRTYGFEIKERGCFANAKVKFPEETSAAVIQILKPTGEVDIFLASQLSARAFDKWPHLKVVNVGEIISGVPFDVTYKLSSDLDISTDLDQIHGKLFKVLSSMSGSFSTEKIYELDTSFSNVIDRLLGLQGFDIVSIVEKISSGKTTIKLVLRESEAIPLNSKHTGKTNDV